MIQFWLEMLCILLLVVPASKQPNAITPTPTPTSQPHTHVHEDYDILDLVTKRFIEPPKVYITMQHEFCFFACV